MKKCIICNKEIQDKNFLLKEKNYENEPKYCEFHRRQIRGYREKVPSIERREIQRWDNVVFVDFAFRFEKDDPESEYKILSFGGRQFGGSWAGVSHTGKELFFVSKKWNRDNPALIRRMEKTVEEESHWYYVVEPAQDETLPVGYIHYIENYYKTTQKGFGRDRNLKHLIESPHETICAGSTSARSGRFGNSFQLIISPDAELRVEKKGEA